MRMAIVSTTVSLGVAVGVRLRHEPAVAGVAATLTKSHHDRCEMQHHWCEIAPRSVRNAASPVRKRTANARWGDRADLWLHHGDRFLGWALVAQRPVGSKFEATPLKESPVQDAWFRGEVPAGKDSIQDGNDSTKPPGYASKSSAHRRPI
jgi:hypothetical protein